MKITRGRVLAAALAAVLAALTGCSGPSTRDAADVPADRIADLKNTRVWRLPDNYRNVTIGCDGPNLVYVTSRDTSSSSSSVFVLPGDPYCQGVTR